MKIERSVPSICVLKLESGGSSLSKMINLISKAQIFEILTGSDMVLFLLKSQESAKVQILLQNLSFRHQ